MCALRRGPTQVYNIYTYIHTYIHAYIHACIHTCMHTYMHTCIHAYKHTYIHIPHNPHIKSAARCISIRQHTSAYVCWSLGNPHIKPDSGVLRIQWFRVQPYADVCWRMLIQACCGFRFQLLLLSARLSKRLSCCSLSRRLPRRRIWGSSKVR